MTQQPIESYPLAGYRLSGGGNDFLAFPELRWVPSAKQIGAWCRRGMSLGADGIFLLDPDPRGARMRYFNADGAAADLCLNGTRCAATLAKHLGWGEPEQGSFEISTAIGWIDAKIEAADTVTLGVPAPENSPRSLELAIDGLTYPAHLVTVGVPILVVEWQESLRDAPIDTLGPLLRSHPDLGEAGANVMFVRYLPDDRLEMRSFERGVEGETLACGTGALGCAAVARQTGRCGPSVSVLTGGGSTFAVVTGTGGRWSLQGDARLIAAIELHQGAESVPAPPSWS